MLAEDSILKIKATHVFKCGTCGKRIIIYDCTREHAIRNVLIQQHHWIHNGMAKQWCSEACHVKAMQTESVCT